jgi:hypothetical protein
LTSSARVSTFSRNPSRFFEKKRLFFESKPPTVPVKLVPGGAMMKKRLIVQTLLSVTNPAAATPFRA